MAFISVSTGKLCHSPSSNERPILDVVGLFPQMLTVVTCAVVVLLRIAVQSVQGKGAPRCEVGEV